MSLLGSVWFLFLKTVFCSKNKENKENMDVWFLVFFLFRKTQKTLIQENKNSFQRTSKVFFLFFQKLFSRTVFKNRNQIGSLFLFLLCAF